MNSENLINELEDNNYSTTILESYLEVENYNKKYSEKLFNFITRCSELEELSEHKYEIQKSLELNKIYFQGYILDSDICNYLKENTNSNYSIEQLRNFINQYENNSNEDLYSYHLALELYELADDIEQIVDDKIEYEMKKIYALTTLIENIENINSNNYEMLYLKIKKELTDNYLNKNLIDDKVFGICIQMLNDIFNYFITGYFDIPDEYLNNANDFSS